MIDDVVERSLGSEPAVVGRFSPLLKANRKAGEPDERGGF
jgi:hypothetical protein